MRTDGAVWPPRCGLAQSLAFVATVAALAMACQTGPSPDSARPGIEATEDGLVISQAVFDEFKERASEYQVEVMEDLKLTFSEYEAAYLAHRQCSVELGFVVTEEHPPSMLNVGGFGLYHPAPDQATKDAVEQCMLTYRIELQRLWAAVHGPSERQSQDARDALAVCVTELEPDLRMPAHPSEHDLFGQMFGQGEDRALHFAACIKRVEEEFGFPPL